jgi:hypothetical protein
MFASLKAGKWSSLSENRLEKLWSIDFEFKPRAHYKKKGTKNEEEEEEEEDGSDEEQHGQDIEESPPSKQAPQHQQ